MWFAALIYSLLSDVPLGKNRIIAFRSGGCFVESDERAKRGNHKQTQQQSELTHVTKSEYITVGFRVNRNHIFRCGTIFARSCTNWGFRVVAVTWDPMAGKRFAPR